MDNQQGSLQRTLSEFGSPISGNGLYHLCVWKDACHFKEELLRACCVQGMKDTQVQRTHRVLTTPSYNLPSDTLSPYPVFFLSSPLMTTTSSIYLVFFKVYFPLLECNCEPSRDLVIFPLLIMSLPREETPNRAIKFTA